MRLVHLTSSRFFGGPERQMLGLAKALPADCETIFASFSEGGRCDEFLKRVRCEGFAARKLQNDTPHLFAARRELAALFHEAKVDVLLCHGYKADLVGRPAARLAGIPVAAVSRGWTGESFKVRWYDRIDRLFLSRMDRVVCVSDGQAAKVRAAGVPDWQIRVIHNAARAEAFREPDPDQRQHMESLFSELPVSAGGEPERSLHPLTRKTRSCQLVMTAGRLSTDKGIHVLLDAVPAVLARAPDARFVICGDGDQRGRLKQQVRDLGIVGFVVFAGFRNDLDQWMPNADLFVLPSFTEGLPNVLLEAHAGGVPVVATAVGGTPELVADGHTGWLVPPGDPKAMADRIVQLLADEDLRSRMGQAARKRVRRHFSFEIQAQEYRDLFDELAGARCAAA